MALSQGDMLGSCEILDLLGKGGMGEVYRGRDARLGREVAVKSLPDVFANDPERVARFEREAQTLASLNHPNIAAIYEFKEFGGSQYLILELVEGETLAERLARGPMPIDEALEAARQIAEALEAAHDKGIVHRDLKPANVKITPEGRVKVLDFGLAKAMEPSSSGARTVAILSDSPTLSAMQTAGGVILGTAGYMSPEQARGKTVDRRADVWGFGCVLYEMLAGRHAFPNGESPSDTLAGVLTREPDWSALPAAIPPKIRALIERCLRKDVRRRLRDMGDALVEIEDVRDGSNAAAAPAQLPARSRERRWAALAVIFFFAAAGALIAPLLQKAPPAPAAPAIRFEVMPPANAGPLTYLHLSPDGRKLAFNTAPRGDMKPFIWIRPLDSVDAQPLASTEGASAVFFWSADSQFIAFSAQGKLKKAAISGGPAVQLLANLPNPTGYTGTWNADGVILLQGKDSELLRLPAADGAAIPETQLDAAKKEQAHLWPNFLPDGRHYFFFVRSRDPQYSVSYVGTLGSKDRRPLPGIASEVKYSPSGHVLFIRNGALMAQRFDATRLEVTGEAAPVADPFVRSDLETGAFSTSLTGSIAYRVARNPANVSQLTWFDRTGKQLGVAGPRGEFLIPELSVDGKFVAFSRQVGIWVLNIEKGVTSRLTSVAGDSMPQWSPTGRSVVFDGTRNSVAGVYERAFGVIGEDKLISNLPNLRNLSNWSPDGQYLVDSDGDIWTVPLAGDRKPVRVTETPSVNETLGKVSPDGRWIAYQSNETGLGLEIYIQSFPERGLKQQVSTSGGYQPRWSANGKELFYVTTDSTLMSVSTKPSGSSLEMGAPVSLFVLPARPNTPGSYNVSPDGRFLVQAISEEEQLAAPITVILNWASGLK